MQKYVKKAVIRAARKVAYKAGRRIRKRYGGKNAVSNLVKDVKILKHLVNIEKKRFDVTVSSGIQVAQTFGAGVSGQYAAIITPFPIEGIAQGQRVGLSIKLVSACMDIQFTQQASAINNIKCKWYIVCRPDNATNYSAGSAIAQFFEPNPFSTVNDYYSSRDPEYFTAFQVVRQGTVNMKQDQITGGTSIVQKKVPLKLNHHLKFNTDASTTTVKNQFYLFVVASGGDAGTATGVSMAYNMRWYYTDN